MLIKPTKMGETPQELETKILFLSFVLLRKTTKAIFVVGYCFKFSFQICQSRC